MVIKLSKYVLPDRAFNCHLMQILRDHGKHMSQCGNDLHFNYEIEVELLRRQFSPSQLFLVIVLYWLNVLPDRDSTLHAL